MAHVTIRHIEPRTHYLGDWELAHSGSICTGCRPGTGASEIGTVEVAY